MENAVSREEYHENCRRLDEENKRQNERLDKLENAVHEINQLTVSVEKLAVNMNNMVNEISEQNGRMERLERRDGDNWKKVVSGIITGIVSGLIAFAMVKLGLG